MEFKPQHICYRSNLFLGMVMYDNEFETQKNKNKK